MSKNHNHDRDGNVSDSAKLHRADRAEQRRFVLVLKL